MDLCLMRSILFFLLISYSFAQYSSENECLEKNVTIYFEGNGNSIEGVRHILNHKTGFESISKIQTSSHVNSMTYDPFSKEILFVENNYPHKIQGVNWAIKPHTIIEQSDIRFKTIAFDTITSNIYYISDEYKIGVCVGRQNKTKCVTLIEQKEHFYSFEYPELVLFSKRGLLFWAAREIVDYRIKSKVKMANMDGTNVHELIQFDDPKSISVDREGNALYVLNEKTVTKLDLNSFTPQTIDLNISPRKLHYFNCEMYYLEWFRIHKSGKQTKLVPSASFKNLILVVADGAWSHDSNPCDDIQCTQSEICVLTEAKLRLKAKCIGANMSNEEKACQTGGFSIAVICLSLILNGALITLIIVIRFNLWPKIRVPFERLLNKKKDTLEHESSVSFKTSTTADDL